MISAFTAAHSITLALASLQWVALLPAVTERAVAVTIILAALAFAFGLVHGFGFAGVLAELRLPRAEFAWALLQFKLGLEPGQLAIVGAVMGALFVLRTQRGHVRYAVQGGSLAAKALGTRRHGGAGGAPAAVAGCRAGGQLCRSSTATPTAPSCR